MVKKILKIVLALLLIVVILAVALFAWLSIKEYKPADPLPLEVTLNEKAESRQPAVGDTISVLGWNIGYAGLGKDSDFFMDGGKEVKAADRDMVNANLNGIYDTVFGSDKNYDVVMLQEVDLNSSRTYSIDQTEKLGVLSNTTYALNYSCPFVPFPMPPIGKVNSGILTTTSYSIETAKRLALPCPFSWPVSTANLKRCLLVNYIPVKDSSKYLVVIDLHLEAYDSGEGKIQQTNQLRELISSEYAAGNYVIAGGDFNQIFPGGLDKYPNEHEELWIPGIIEDDIMPSDWTVAYDLDTPTCRLLNQPYDPSDTANTQYYTIDGFILSPNIQLNTVKTLDEGFVYSDHNPVELSITLK